MRRTKLLDGRLQLLVLVYIHLINMLLLSSLGACTINKCRRTFASNLGVAKSVGELQSSLENLLFHLFSDLIYINNANLFRFKLILSSCY